MAISPCLPEWQQAPFGEFSYLPRSCRLSLPPALSFGALPLGFLAPAPELLGPGQAAVLVRHVDLPGRQQALRDERPGPLGVVAAWRYGVAVAVKDAVLHPAVLLNADPLEELVALAPPVPLCMWSPFLACALPSPSHGHQAGRGNGHGDTRLLWAERARRQQVPHQYNGRSKDSSLYFYTRMQMVDNKERV